MILADTEKPLLAQAIQLIADCRVSQGNRAAAYRSYAQWVETGQAAGNLALCNLLYSHVDRLASHLFSPTDLRFDIDFESYHNKEILLQAKVAARVLSREWERQNIDTTFGDGVKEALTYGACIDKLLCRANGQKVDITSRLVMPWNFGVYNESINEMSEQEAVCETVYLNKHEVWRRIRHLPDANKLYKRILSSGAKDAGVGPPSSFMHQVLSTAILDTSLQNATNPLPGGIVQVSNNPSMAVLGPEVAADLIPMHELWVRDDERDYDWTTVQVIAPDVLVAPRLKYTNLFCPETLPFELIQPNKVTNYFWGRSEIVDLMQLQALLTSTLDDIKRVFGNNFDKLLAFPGYDGLTDELYGQFRRQGYIGMPQGATVSDLTPQLPTASFEYVNMIQGMMDKVSGFNNILSGSGESGVRAGVHADTLMRTASPRLRDRALLVERQCASTGDKTLAALQAKGTYAYWTDNDANPAKEFLLESLPDDARVVVDSHSSSPIYAQDHDALVWNGLKTGVVDKESAIEMLPFPKKDILVQRLKDAQAAQAELIKEHPEILTHQKAGHK